MLPKKTQLMEVEDRGSMIEDGKEALNSILYSPSSILSGVA
jgi:hypothetical protein